MSHVESALFSPYGAFELKAKYQRNFAMGTAAVLGLVVLILVVTWVMSSMGEEQAINSAPTVIKTIADLGPPPTIAKAKPQVQVNEPNVAAPKVGIPVPVADEEAPEEAVRRITGLAELYGSGYHDFFRACSLRQGADDRGEAARRLQRPSLSPVLDRAR